MDSDETVVGDGGVGAWRELPAGTLLDNYRIERLLGRGGMGAVYLAEHVRLKKQYAIKVLPEGLGSDIRFRERFEAEGQRMAALEHPGIVPVYYSGESGGQRYFAMEYLPGGDLEQRLQAAGGRLPEAEVREILKQILEALQYAHDKGIIHRDLKPANLLLTDDGRVKISDFGLAQVVGEGYMKSLVQQTVAASMLGGAETQLASGGSASPNYAGTVHFMAPEVMSGGAATPQSDLYAVGVIGYYLLTGRKPMGKYKDASRLVPDLGSNWNQWFDGLMEPDAEDRTATTEQALAGLENMANDFGGIPSGRTDARHHPVEKRLPRIPESREQGPPWKWIIAAAVVLLVAGLGVLHFIGSPFDSSGRSHLTETIVDKDPETVSVGSGKEVRGPVPGQNAAVELPGGMELAMVWIRPGEFVMGEGNSVMQVRLTKAYWLGRTPVTQGQWSALMGNNLSHFKQSGLNAPVESVSWNDALEFCRKLTERERAAGRLPAGYEYTLPSEAQWEYAARAGTTTRWSFGDDEGRLGNFGWFGGNSGGQTRPVGQKGANPWGLHDVHGNVWEWTRTWYGTYPGGSVTDHEGPGSGSYRVSRGGSWYRTADGSRSAFRGRLTPDSRYHLGFRLALSSVQ